MSRCPWAEGNALLQDYHDHEWGTPVADDGWLFEHLMLTTFQVGFPFKAVLARRENLRLALAGFDAERLARFTETDVQRLLQDASIFRNHRKITAAIQNAAAWLKLRKEVGTDRIIYWLCELVGGKPRQNGWQSAAAVPMVTPEGDLLAALLKKRNFANLGPFGCYSYLQAIGVVNDHLLNCPRHQQCQEQAAEL